MKRKEFIKSLGIAAIGVAVAPLIPTDEFDTPYRYTLQWPDFSKAEGPIDILQVAKYQVMQGEYCPNSVMMIVDECELEPARIKGMLLMPRDL